MRSSLIAALAVAASTANAHSIFHKVFINGADQGQNYGVRVPTLNSPVVDVSSQAIVCNTGLKSPVSKDVIEVNPGDNFGMQWNHEGGDPKAGDADDPVASSHKGPMMAYMAKVDDASSNDGSNLKWFKVAEEGLDTTTGKWGVDTLIANKGLWSFKMPDLAPGDYLMRGELLALHAAGQENGAQFYMSCAGIRVGGSGTCSPSETVSFPGAYSSKDPGVLISIYDGTGTPNNGLKPYTIPGPSVVDCGSSSGGPSGGSSSSLPSSSQSTAASTSSAVSPAKTTSSTTTASVSSKPTKHGHNYGSTWSDLPSTFMTSTRRPRPSQSQVEPANTSSSQASDVDSHSTGMPENPPTSTAPVAPASTTTEAAPVTSSPTEWGNYPSPSTTTSVSGTGSDGPKNPPSDGPKGGHGKPHRMVCYEEPDEE